mmetsp:Transcript_16518/g.35805  ORF Transcript_16518/g.35805 Transcript_16518/m.35805 type:complete len:174 (+) Transcript_16518:22-543(+)
MLVSARLSWHSCLRTSVQRAFHARFASQIAPHRVETRLGALCPAIRRPQHPPMLLLANSHHVLAMRQPLPLLSLLSPPAPTAVTLLLARCKGHAHSYPVPSGKKSKFKLKTHQGSKKRFRRRADGEYIHGHIGKRHLQVGTSRHRVGLRKRGTKVAFKGLKRQLKRLLPHGTR